MPDFGIEIDPNSKVEGLIPCYGNTWNHVPVIFARKCILLVFFFKSGFDKLVFCPQFLHLTTGCSIKLFSFFKQDMIEDIEVFLLPTKPWIEVSIFSLISVHVMSMDFHMR